MGDGKRTDPHRSFWETGLWSSWNRGGRGGWGEDRPSQELLGAGSVLVCFLGTGSMTLCFVLSTGWAWSASVFPVLGTRHVPAVGFGASLGMHAHIHAHINLCV